MDRLIESFKYANRWNFPKSECIFQDEKEHDVYRGEELYEIVAIDVRFKDYKTSVYAYPYIWIDENKTVHYGWQSKDGAIAYGTMEKTAQFTDEFVIAHRKVSQEEYEFDINFFNQCVGKIEEQYT